MVTSNVESGGHAAGARSGVTLGEPGAVLVVEASEAQRLDLARTIEGAGYRVSTAASGVDALDALRVGAYDVILLDILMPADDGFRVLEQMQTARRLRDIPVVVLSSLDDVASVVRCIELGADDFVPKQADPAVMRAKIASWVEKKQLLDLGRGFLHELRDERRRAETLLNVVIPMGVGLAEERDFNRLLERILIEAKNLCNAEGGTLYLKTEDDQLKFFILRNDSLSTALGGTSGNPIDLPNVLLYDSQTSQPNHSNVASYVALSGESINILDAYTTAGFDFSGTRAFDERTGYRSKSFLTVPLKKQQGKVIGVLQLINSLDPDTGEVIAFSSRLQEVVEALSLLAAAALDAYIREQSLRHEVQQLKVEIDQMKRAKEVEKITGSDYFQKLKSRADELRRAARSTKSDES